jgi:hypothetical protein
VSSSRGVKDFEREKNKNDLKETMRSKYLKLTSRTCFRWDME